MMVISIQIPYSVSNGVSINGSKKAERTSCMREEIPPYSSPIKNAAKTAAISSAPRIIPKMRPSFMALRCDQSERPEFREQSV